MNKRIIRLTESDLRNIIKESINNVLNERYSLDSVGLPTTDEDFCDLISERLLKGKFHITELLSELDQQMSQPFKKRFSQVIKELQKAHVSLEKAGNLNTRIETEIRFGSKEPYSGGGEYERGLENRSW